MNFPFRTGRHPADEPGPRKRTIYDSSGELVGSFDTTQLAVIAVACMNFIWENGYLGEALEGLEEFLPENFPE